uniref:Uncharacterized protein n=1 Tax=Rhizophora mucronata TaxID=61149 RepID=A0A2P2QGH9_RHIMU
MIKLECFLLLPVSCYIRNQRVRPFNLTMPCIYLFKVVLPVVSLPPEKSIF